MYKDIHWSLVLHSKRLESTKGQCEESWVPKNWCFWTVVLEKTLESPLDCKEIWSVHSKGDQSWVFIGRTDAESETPILWPPHAKSWLIGKDTDAGRDWGQKEKGMTEDEMAGLHHWLCVHSLSELQEMVMDREAWRAVIHGVSKSQTQLSNWTVLNCTVKLYLQILVYVCMHAKLLQLCLTLRDPVSCSSPNSSVHEILQASILEWVALLQGIFPTQGLNPYLISLLRWQVDSLPLMPPERPHLSVY